MISNSGPLRFVANRQVRHPIGQLALLRRQGATDMFQVTVFLWHPIGINRQSENIGA